ncbi:hypothetical protein WJX75_003521 [Coccomyxa subellipsoidea]|uniref:NAD(P)-binding protein n=1 Tax=Coccomyxa subellipsoidea TaxID=248742 RepID=A0ABR2Z185_9CHLO
MVDQRRSQTSAYQPKYDTPGRQDLPNGTPLSRHPSDALSRKASPKALLDGDGIAQGQITIVAEAVAQYEQKILQGQRSRKGRFSGASTPDVSRHASVCSSEHVTPREHPSSGVPCTAAEPHSNGTVPRSSAVPDSSVAETGEPHATAEPHSNRSAPRSRGAPDSLEPEWVAAFRRVVSLAVNTPLSQSPAARAVASANAGQQSDGVPGPSKLAPSPSSEINDSENSQIGGRSGPFSRSGGGRNLDTAFESTLTDSRRKRLRADSSAHGSGSVVRAAAAVQRAAERATLDRNDYSGARISQEAASVLSPGAIALVNGRTAHSPAELQAQLSDVVHQLRFCLASMSEQQRPLLHAADILQAAMVPRRDLAEAVEKLQEAERLRRWSEIAQSENIARLLGILGEMQAVQQARTEESPREFTCPDAADLHQGGAIGIGFELAREAIARGAAAISLIDIADCSKAILLLRDEAADGVSAVFRAKIAAFKADVSNFDEISRAIADCEATQGPLDIIIANAGIGPCGMFLEEEGVAHWDKVMRINYMGVVCTLKAALPGMVARNKGRIIVTNSSGGFMGAAGISAYCGSKFAVRGFLDSLRLELIHTDVCVHMACPGFVNTTMIRQAQKEASDTVKQLKAAFVPAMMTAEEVARFTWKGVEKGQYVIGSPDSGGNMLIGSSLAANSARYYPAWMEFLLAPLFVLVHALIRRGVEASTKKILTATELQLPVSSANGGGKSSKDE